MKALLELTQEQLKFLSTWRVSSSHPSITLPLASDGEYDFQVSWGDGTESRITRFNQPEATHHYPTPGDYLVCITGLICGFAFGSNISYDSKESDIGNIAKTQLSGDTALVQRPHPCCSQIIDISQWGGLRLSSRGHQFYGCDHLRISAKDSPCLLKVSSLSSMFEQASVVNGDFSGWDTRNVTDMSHMFSGAYLFNSDLSRW